MTYLEFNRWAYDYYRSTTIENGICCLAIDEYEIEIFKRRYSLKDLHFKEVRLAPWSKLLLPDNYCRTKIPSYFGLIALQCLAASYMENSESNLSLTSNDGGNRISVTNFSNRFCSITGIDKSALMGFYSELFNGIPIQEVLWSRAKSYLHDTLGFSLNIPDRIEGTGRYIQFPKSQVVLNKEDLKEIADKVLSRLVLDDAVSEKKFTEFFYKEFLTKSFQRNNNKSKHEGETQDIFFKQVFNYYNSEEWNSLVDRKEISNSRRKATYFIEFGLEDVIHFYHHMTEVHQVYEIFKGGNLYIFERVAGSFEFGQSNLFSLNTDLILVSSRPLRLGTDVNHIHSGLNIVRCLFNSSEEIPVFLKSRLRNPKDEVPVYLKGLRLGHTWNYIQNFGPEIIGEDFIVLYTDFDNPKEQKIVEDYNSLNCKAGLYKVRVPGFVSLRFVVLDQKNILSIDELDCGLKLNSFTIGTDGILLKGLGLSGNSVSTINKEININQWVKACTAQDFLSANNLLKSIKYQHYDQ